MTIELRPHQAEAVEKMHNGCVLWGGVGTGKTITALAYAQLREAGRNIVVVTTAKKRDSGDWDAEAALLGLPFDGVYVTSWNKIKEHELDERKFFIFDEQRLVGTGAWVKSFYKIAAKNHWILLSATPGDTWTDYAPMFIANGWYKNITDFRRQHVVYSSYTKFPKIERYLGTGKLMKHRANLLVKMPMERHTTRHMHYIECDYDHELLDFVRKKRWNIYKDEPIVNAAELYSVLRRVVSSDATRATEILKLMAKHPKLIIFYNFNYELEALRDLLTEYQTFQKICSLTYETDSLPSFDGLDSCGWPPDDSINSESPVEASTTTSASPKGATEKPAFAWAEWNGHKHQPIPETDSWVYLVQYASGSEGWNCTETDAMAFWSLTYSYKQYWQAQGRIDRMNTKYEDLHYYVLLTNSFAEKPVIRALEQKKDFQPR